MSEYDNAVSQKAREQDINIAAAKMQTAPLMRTGWTVVIVGWALPVIPIIGMAGFVISAFAGIIFGIIVASRGNTTGGILLILAGIFATWIVALVWFLIYMALGATLAY